MLVWLRPVGKGWFITLEEISELLLQRRRKVDALWEQGINPYPNDFKPSHTSADVFAAYGDILEIPQDPEEFVVAGRIMARRSFGKAAFIQVQDRKGRLQLYIKKDTIGEDGFAFFETFDIGDIIGVHGFPFRTKTGELSLHVTQVRHLVKSLLPPARERLDEPDLIGFNISMPWAISKSN